MQKLLLFFLILVPISLLSAPNYKPFDSSALSELAHSRSRSVISLAGNWEHTANNLTSDKSIPYTDSNKGKIVLKKTFRISKDVIDNKHTSIYFPGIAHDCKLYINNDFVIKLSGALIPTTVPISGSRLVAGVNEIMLEFEPEADIIRLQNLSLVTNPQAARGILREPLIISTSKIFVNELTCTNHTANKLNATLKIIQAGLMSGASKTRITVEYGLINKETRLVACAPVYKEVLAENARTTTLKFDLPLTSLSPWTPEQPALYELYVKLLHNGAPIDEYFINASRQTIKCNDNNITLNGAPFEIKAITYNEFHGNYKSTLPQTLLESDVHKIKLLGANAIRLRFMPPNPYLMSLCDKYGLLVFIDLPLNNINSYLLTNQEFISYSKNILSQILSAYQSHPSFAGIGLGDGLEEKTGYNVFLDEMLKLTKQYQVLKYKAIECGTIPVKRNNADFDFLICKTNNVYNTNDKLATYVSALKSKLTKQVPIILNCFTNVFPDNLNGYSDKFSATYQSYFFQNCYNFSKQQKLAGILINSFNDYKTGYPILALDYWDQYRSTDGITDLYRQDKPAALMLKNLFLNDKLPLLNRGNFEQIQTTSYIIIGLIALVILLYILNWYNRFREYFFRAFLRSYNFFSDIRDKRIIPTPQTVILGILTSVGIALCISSLLFSMRYDINSSFLLSAVLPFPAILSFLFKIIYLPEFLFLTITVLFLLLTLLITLIIFVIALLLRKNLSFKQCFSIVVWISIPALILLPIGIILSKLFLVAGSIVIAVLAAIYALLIINWFYRFFKAMSIIFDWTTIKVYCFGFIFIIALVIMPVVYYESQLTILPFVKYFFSMP